MTDTPNDQEARDFAGFILELPQAHRDVGAKMQECIAAVRDTGKAGEVTLKLKVKMLSPESSTELVITPVVTATLPKHDLKPGVFYADLNNNPRRENTSNPGLFADEEVRDVRADRSTGEVIKEA